MAAAIKKRCEPFLAADYNILTARTTSSTKRSGLVINAEPTLLFHGYGIKICEARLGLKDDDALLFFARSLLTKKGWRLFLFLFALILLSDRLTNKFKVAASPNTFFFQVVQPDWFKFVKHRLFRSGGAPFKKDGM